MQTAKTWNGKFKTALLSTFLKDNGFVVEISQLTVFQPLRGKKVHSFVEMTMTDKGISKKAIIIFYGYFFNYLFKNFYLKDWKVDQQSTIIDSFCVAHVGKHLWYDSNSIPSYKMFKHGSFAKRNLRKQLWCRVDAWK